VENAMSTAFWPKTLPALSPRQVAISADFMRYWHEVLPQRYRWVERFNHGFVARTAPEWYRRCLEIGPGLGEHLNYEQMRRGQKYVGIDIRPNMVAELAARRPEITAVCGDIQKPLDYAAGHFDRVIAIHVLEHLPDLPAAIKEIHRLIAKPGGLFQVVIPCEGGLAYWMARRIGAQRLFEQRYGESYRWFIEREHLNRPREIIRELKQWFHVSSMAWFPLGIPAVFCNWCIGLNLQPREE
jgi:SAM-dependent methyltransferase